jgi:hypothetical protein
MLLTRLEGRLSKIEYDKKGYIIALEMTANIGDCMVRIEIDKPELLLPIYAGQVEYNISQEDHRPAMRVITHVD